MSRQLFKYSSENHGYCNAIMQVAVVACLGMKDSPGRNAGISRKNLPETFPYRRGLNKGRGKMVIFRMLQHGENDANRTGSMN